MWNLLANLNRLPLSLFSRVLIHSTVYIFPLLLLKFPSVFLLFFSGHDQQQSAPETAAFRGPVAHGPQQPVERRAPPHLQPQVPLSRLPPHRVYVEENLQHLQEARAVPGLGRRPRSCCCGAVVR